MTALPVITGFGGLNSAGRSSGFHGYKRILADVLPADIMELTWRDLAWRMKVCPKGTNPTAAQIDAIRAGTLLRRIDSFDVDAVPGWQQARLEGVGGVSSMVLPKSRLPQQIPANWQVEECGANDVRITVPEGLEVLFPRLQKSPVSSGSNIPAGFDPGELYNAHHHPRGLRLGVYGASDALNSLGFDWQTVLRHVRPEAVSVYAGSALGQLDGDAFGGLFSRYLSGNRPSSKMLPLALAEMPADFVNSYILNSVGSTGANLGACATFLYNLRQGAIDIQTGRARVVFVGSAEAPMVPEVIEGFNVMGALASDDSLRALDGGILDNRRACRPFSTNVGFTLGEASQFVVLMDDALALELGAMVYGAVPDVFINADANKKSISKPGVGNYLTMARATALAHSILGQSGLARTAVSAHGTGTPQNRTSESHILNEVAKAFSLNQWPVMAIKSCLGHSVSAAGGDQLVTALGTWRYGWLPGIKTIDHLADDIHHSHLDILMDHKEVGISGIDGIFLNSKGFGGNNATALVLSPEQTLKMLKKRHGDKVVQQWQMRNVAVAERASLQDKAACNGEESLVYRFGENIINDNDVHITPQSLTLPEFPLPVDLTGLNAYTDYC
ncbi:3-oxoacyl-ACP synthase [Legionella geestiana]|uniref:3-oxoacyl-ACP synthase n=1 Tax=Legionella geestiana TaxID=45065 RepID=A0A0W0TTQ3_9GAMM|nr:beta-ketoacyl synthase [Legionella geestiana]KTC98805.1 3-oxoacyl-ACP synthase [Legionella geestiana]QBS12809.1 beta-ketoacyl synthase [Legionella geestiana]QDQ39474.1 beta-ketoacyl synthase [Legionella geestiana]STX54711.1 3-oxoacyl-ACP synthase [Legionella geestiana]